MNQDTLLIEAAANFVKENTKVLCINLEDSLIKSIFPNQKLVTIIDKDKINYVNLSLGEVLTDKDVFDLIFIKNIRFSSDDITKYLKSFGHLISSQKGLGEYPDFNLENIAEDLENNSYKIVRSKQKYDISSSDKNTHQFFILAKKIK